ncbi:MAG: methylamine utilization protein [Flavobacterium sp. MedPE-SWcel]|uniref:cytochrome-c peroxidase n=1 Tax=uncultured Flavobacterium sp. TaxID=165435 RepID=UPI0009233841|nr:cytochrome c peroxidase [uncultured Flavobacterium sp.]OIQ18694.1 MAG: methylamine utilization protein [Flavobacterium sp. MedPE-SWcel]
MNITNIKTKKTQINFLCLLFIAIVSCSKKTETTEYSAIKNVEINYISHLDSTVIYLDSLKQSAPKDAERFYIKARDQFKHIEPILAFTDRNNYKSLNAPNLLKVEEEDATNIKIMAPFGFQVIEESIYEEEPNWEQIQKVVEKTSNRLKLIKNNTVLDLKDYHIIWLLRDEISRVALTGITGYDSPVLEASLKEAVTSYKGMLDVIKPFESNFQSEELYNQLIVEINNTIDDLNKGNFNTFDRYSFIKTHTHKQLEILQEVSNDWKVKYPFETAFNNSMTSLFSNNTFNLNFFADYNEVDSLMLPKMKLGKQLFNDTRLSADNSISCASCHKENLAFTDGLKTFPKQIRNSPTLLYAAYQQSFFMDGRTGNLEGQIVDVVNNPNEFHSSLNNITALINEDTEYKEEFKEIYGDEITERKARNAIATYIRSLGQFNSKFDKNINNEENTLTASEINGFNLFSGKAKCATCHFAPLFNGTVPPNFTESELELIGVPKDTVSNVIDTDLGRYNSFNTEERKHFFKTPTIRNVSKTGPYMHNGIYTSLLQVVDFYDIGGGAGLDIDLEHQTLPADSLNLSEKEKKDLIAFMNSLTDKE